MSKRQYEITPKNRVIIFFLNSVKPQPKNRHNNTPIFFIIPSVRILGLSLPEVISTNFPQ